MCSSKFYTVPCPGIEGGLLPAAFPQLALVHFPVVWVQDRHQLIYAGHRPQLLLQVFAFKSLDLAPVGLRFREAQSRLEGGDGGGRLARTGDQRSGEQGTRQRQEAQQVHGGWTGSREAGPLAGAGWGVRLRSSPGPCPVVSSRGPPWASVSRDSAARNFCPRLWQPSRGRGSRVSGTSLTGNRTSELPSVAAREVKRGRRLRRSRFCFWCFAKKRGWGG